mmetsp:Transcript_3029/g.4626  ORF Transcript_3029/g.4626 Transcript_3029/m.4626 type:complete len:417 (-) Transcript_3029:254-1504(-)|eukprot:CAMPEP_0185027426 /NCGR_PEP_ID=MMETSP1103-20130426/12469_1 /TAXON_ID=36769 /ORGANISM="Paraphysomonas bandaiensis, Strain Caron Lab Isolate" /LENGTH=416 /DNA_ID=CAMNT_0027561413 /DNA_START=55 /DNA_END=1305 /DNA_ORIENTATION=-
MATRTYHRFKASGQQFEVESKYSFIRPIGHGAYGVVISALDKSTSQKVAIKKITRAFDDPVDAKRILREIKLMKKFSHENVIRIVDIIAPSPTIEEFEDVYIVQDLMETDLHRIIYSRQPLTIDHVQYFVYQILRGLKYIHSANVIHRDLKPSNLLVNANCDLKICDFGLARGVEDEQSGALTEYVVTRWYRAPEIMLACHEYTRAIDVWSVGCIFAELLARQALFPGEDYIAQLRLICDKMGRPAENDLDFVTSDRAKQFIASLPVKKPQPMTEMFPDHKGEKEAHDLLRKMLEFHPHRRISIEDALAHPFMSSLHNPDDEPIADFTFDFAFEDDDLSRERVQALIWDEIRELHPDIPETCPSATPRKKTSKAGSGVFADAKADAKSEVDDDSKTAPNDSPKRSTRKRSASPSDK